ncbi:hypothetical protein QVE09_24105 [Paenibacillus sp. ClWae2A]|uniref:hypothetical protein n=1 Tax=Paenibacillus sp. ClWae2A TaxID=3057177 RepID=UPI0028F587AE|nr:hypothetical protein [Paenibacillus sp. ClWae2A]MDT9721996.1 hypothetical protein [Paenibacillus sp. ClWae2A]
MDYAKSKYAIVDGAASYIESHLKYKWFTPPGTAYDLETLVLQDIKSITTFEPLKEFTKLKSLTFGYANIENLDVTKLKPKSWDFISTLTGLEILDLCKTSFSDPSLLLNLPNLKKVRLSVSDVDPESSRFKALEEVMLQREGNLIMK